ncbi:MAG TPA: tetratricopeptide repeat protein [Candidatus Saccharimonadales bacterium]|nr:tetratricopeptide repeat protein [Candidatus Saccharimonadales bacterium]
MGATDRFTRTEFQRLLDVTDKQLNYWERLQLVSPRKGGAEKFYDFRDLITLRTAKQLIEKGVSANRLRRSLVALNEKLSQVQAPLTELRILANGRDVIVEHDGARLEPISGQFVLNFDTRELRDKVRVMPERSAQDWFSAALQYEADPASRAEAIDAYGRVLSANPGHVDALINLGMLSYDGGDLEKAADCFRRAVALEDDNAVARFNLGSVLEEMGELEEARQHLRLAVRLDPRYADAHYNLAFVCEKLAAGSEAREHWQRYVELDPGSPWCDYARHRLSTPKP